MHISHTVAKEIAEQLSETIHHKINLMNTEGIIIASSDPSRIGQLHGGSKKLIEENLPYLLVEDDSQFEGSRNGVNLPILFENEIVGTIGITGPVAEVFQYGKIIKRMTEILLLDRKTKEQQVIEQKAKDRFFDEWILGRLEERNDSEFRRMASTFSINPERPLRIAVLSFGSGDALSDAILTEISRQVRHVIGATLNGNAFRTATQMVCIIDDLQDDFILQEMDKLLHQIQLQYHCVCQGGLDATASVLHLHENYTLASRALEIAKRNGKTILAFDPYHLDFMIDSIPKEARDRLLHSLFPHQTSEEIKSYLSFAKIYLEENGSLTAISERLFLHKSTIKYRIHKLYDITGIDIRTCRGAYLFTLATTFMPVLPEPADTYSKTCLMLS